VDADRHQAQGVAAEPPLRGTEPGKKRGRRRRKRRKPAEAPLPPIGDQ
jgi:hypothetical protein